MRVSTRFNSLFSGQTFVTCQSEMGQLVVHPLESKKEKFRCTIKQNVYKIDWRNRIECNGKLKYGTDMIPFWSHSMVDGHAHMRTNFKQLIIIILCIIIIIYKVIMSESGSGLIKYK